MPTNKALQDLIKNIEELMVGRGWRQKDLSEASGISQGAISTYLSGRVAPQLDALTRIADAFGVHPSRLIMGEDQDEIVVRYKRVLPPKSEMIDIIKRDLTFLSHVPEEALALLREVHQKNLWDGLVPLLRTMIRQKRKFRNEEPAEEQEKPQEPSSGKKLRSG